MTDKINNEQKLYSEWPKVDYWTNESEECISCGSLSFLEKGSPLVEMQPTTDEEELIQKFYEKIKNVREKNTQRCQKSLGDPSINYIENALEDIKDMVDEYLEQGLRLNSRYRDKDKNEDEGETVTNLIFGKVLDVLSERFCRPTTDRYCGFSRIIYDQDNDDENELSERSLNIIKHITSKLVLRGGKIRYDFYHDNNMIEQVTSNFEDDLDAQHKEVEDKLKNIAYESILNKSEHTQKDRLEVNIIDNGCFYVKYAQDSIVEPAQITNNQKMKDPELRVCVLQIGENTVRIKSVGGKRNYTDISGSIEMSFVTKVGKISICLHCSGENNNEIKVEFANEESKARFDKLEDGEKKSLGPDCLLGGKSVSEAVVDKSFEKNGSVPDAPSTSMKQIRLNQLMKKEGIALAG
ncbi:hypothetical protein GOM44_04660 [Wolbachia endosymbiont of Atemnus politus]|nr:hypothetical protein [Wolbachia endosymbiont of Atemnus politus]